LFYPVAVGIVKKIVARLNRKIILAGSMNLRGGSLGVFAFNGLVAIGSKTLADRHNAPISIKLVNFNFMLVSKKIKLNILSADSK
jgi:hypothetical protein